MGQEKKSLKPLIYKEKSAIAGESGEGLFLNT
nr:MAG TPA: hypothetical protein [Caudoviricetes sp.]